MMLYTNQREAIVREAATWRGTPYRGWARMKHCGADCIGFVAGVFINCGHISEEAAQAAIPQAYSLQIGQHQETTEYVAGILRFMREIPESEVKAGDVVMFKLKNNFAFSHSAIVVRWPLVIHTMAHGGVRDADANRMPLLAGTARRFFTLDGKK
jgi:cell wall-associated NlpC family hydrolase